MLIDPSKSALENVFELISDTAGTTISPDDITLGHPQPWKSIYAMERNTTVLAERVPGSNYNGPLQFYYRRENLSKYDGVLERGLPEDTEVTEEIMQSFLRDFGIIPEECSFGTLTPNLTNNGNYVVTVSAKATSYVYQGNSVLVMTPDAISLSARLMENGGYRLLEDGTVRLLEG